MSEEYHQVVCPSCGAPLTMTGRQTECEFCGAIIERTEPPEPELAEPQVVVKIRPDVIAPPVVRPRWRACVVLIVPVITLAVVGLVVYILIARESPPRVGRRSVREPAIILPSDRVGPADVLVFTYQIDEEIYTLAYLDGIEHKLRWDSPPLSSSFAPGMVAADSTRVYVADEMQLLALNRTDGTVAWQGSLADTMVHYCQECLRAVGNYVIVLTQDGTLHSFEAQTGALAWSKLLNGTPDRLLLVNDRPAVVDLDESKDWNKIALYIWDPASGELIQRITPHCSDGSTTDSLDLDSTVLVGPSGDAVYFFYGILPGCGERWDAINGEMVWQMVAPDQYFDFRTPSLQTREAIYASYRGVTIAVDIRTGGLRQLTDEENYELLPLAHQEGILVVRARRTRGSERFELWGLDATTGERKWQLLMQEEEPLSEPGAWAGSAWDAHLTQQGLVLLHLLPEPPRVVVETLDPQSGASSGQVTSQLDDDSAYWEGLTWSDDTAWLTIRKVHAIDLASGEVIYSWP